MQPQHDLPQSKRALVIHRDWHTATRLRHSLETEGYAVEVHHDCDDGICAAATGEYDLVAVNIHQMGWDKHGFGPGIAILQPNEQYVMYRERRMLNGVDDGVVSPQATDMPVPVDPVKSGSVNRLVKRVGDTIFRRKAEMGQRKTDHPSEAV